MRKLKKIDVDFISLVDKGANRKKLIFKRDGGGGIEKMLSINKIDEEQRIIFCIVYSPDEADTQGDFAPADVIKDAAYNFMKCARTNNVDKQHDFVPDEGYVAESWIVKENDPVFPNEPAGSWAVAIKVENEETWRMVKEGEITGVSLAGQAAVEEIEKQEEALIEKVKNLIAAETNAMAEAIKLEVIQAMEAAKAPIDAAIEKNAGDNASLKEKIESLEKMNLTFEERIAACEKTTPLSRQVKREEETRMQNLKIWT